MYLKEQLTQYLAKPVRLDLLGKWLCRPSARILDIGCGNHSASKMKKYYPDCKYYGLDANKYYNNGNEDFQAMEEFYEIDLNCVPEDLNVVPDNYFDCIICSHVIEHLKHGEDILEYLFPKLKNGGILYIETPSPRSLHLPRMLGLNFYNDTTHVRVYFPDKIELLLKSRYFSIIESRVKRSVKRILLLPVYIFGSLFCYRHISPSVFYDITGFAHYIIAEKNNINTGENKNYS